MFEAAPSLEAVLSRFRAAHGELPLALVELRCSGFLLARPIFLGPPDPELLSRLTGTSTLAALEEAAASRWPERWAGGLERSLPRCCYFPFGAGPRICIGQQFALMEARLLLASLVSKFRFTLAPGQGVEEEAAVTLRPKNGLRMRLEAVRGG